MLEGVTLDTPGESVDLLVGEIVPDDDPCEEELPLETCGTIAPLLKGVSAPSLDGVSWNLAPPPKDAWIIDIEVEGACGMDAPLPGRSSSFVSEDRKDSAPLSA